MKYLCLPSLGGRYDQTILAGAFIEAESEQEAAAAAYEVIDREDDQNDKEYLFNMFVMEIKGGTFTAFRQQPRYVRAADEFQCCGGPCEFTRDHHYATCPNHEDEDAGTEG